MSQFPLGKLTHPALFHFEVDGVNVEAGEQRVAHFDGVAGGQLAPGAGRLDVGDGRDVAQAQTAERLSGGVGRERREAQRADGTSRAGCT